MIMSSSRWRPSDARADVHVAVEAGAWYVPVRPAHTLGLGADGRCLGSRAQVVVAARRSSAGGQPRSQARAEVCAPQPALAGKSLSTNFRFILLILCSHAAVHRTHLPLPPDGARPRYERRMATFFFKARAQADSFCTGDRSARGCGCAGGCEDSRLRRAARGECPRARIGIG